MKKIVFVLVALALAAFPVTVYAGDGVLNNPNNFELDMNCEGEMIHVIIPSGAGESSGGRTEDGMIGHPRTHKIDLNYAENGNVFDGSWEYEFILAKGNGFDTVWCTWTWAYDGYQYLHGMDIQFVPAK
jgi:hypothetical protein